MNASFKIDWVAFSSADWGGWNGKAFARVGKWRIVMFGNNYRNGNTRYVDMCWFWLRKDTLRSEGLVSIDATEDANASDFKRVLVESLVVLMSWSKDQMTEDMTNQSKGLWVQKRVDSSGRRPRFSPAKFMRHAWGTWCVCSSTNQQATVSQ